MRGSKGPSGTPWGSYGIHPRDPWVPPRDPEVPPRDPWVPPRDLWVPPRDPWGVEYINYSYYKDVSFKGIKIDE